jgi:hypothetical protein
MATYAPEHHRLLTRAQTDKFVADLTHAKDAGDTEKAVEQAINALLIAGLSKAHPDAAITHDYRHNTDGYIALSAAASLTAPYALLVEAKRDLDLSGSRRDRAVVYAQVCWYLRSLAQSGALVPAVAVVCDVDEVFALPAQRLAQYYTDDTYAWDEHAASDMYKDSTLLAALMGDSNVQRPYVHDIADGFDPDMFIWAIDAMGQGHDPIRVPVNSTSMDHVFTRFKMEVLGTDATGLKNKDEIRLFIDVLRGDEDVYPHPKKPNTLVVGTNHITLDTYRFEQFWSQYVVGDYTLAELKSLTEVADTLIEEADRRFTGDFWTPPRWVDKAHEYIEDALGTNWKERYVVVDPAAGTLNLTRDYRFKELYSSTLFQEELDIASDYNPEATKFQYDFLNDDMVLHEDVMTADKALELARSGELKLPMGLVEALAANKPVVFFANPPYGSNGNGTKADGRKGGIAKTSVCDLMSDLGHAKQELYTQFIWRTKELAKVFGYTSDFHFFFFNKTFLTSPNFGKFTSELASEFTFKDGFMMNAGEFSGTSSAWGIVFSHFEVGGTNQREFVYTVLESDKDMSISKVADWRGRSVRRGETISDWFADIALPSEKQADFPLTKNGIDAPTSKSVYLTPRAGSIGYLQNQSNNVQFSDKYTGMYSLGFSHAHGRDITRDNFTRAAVTFSIRRAVQEDIAAQKLLWVRDKDIFTRPPESLLTPEFIADCVIYSLFDRQSNQTSLRDYEYKGRTYRVINEFFPYSTTAMLDLAQQHRNRTIEGDLTGEDERFVHTWIEDHRDDLSSEAAAVLDTAWEIIQDSFTKRATHAVVAPRYQVNTWDAGWKQIAAMVFGRERVDDDIYNAYYTDWRAAVRELGDKIARAAQDAGVI